MDKVSIIIPVYNVAQYIEECLKSIQEQSHFNIEIILVNDGSTDKSEQIIESIICSDTRFVYLKQKNKGVSAARNAGISVATGDYVLFVDGDDVLEKNCIDILLKVAQKEGSDVVLFPFVKLFEKHQEECLLFGRRTSTSFNFRDYVYRRLFGLLDDELCKPLEIERLNTVWGKLYTYSVIKNIAFQDMDKIGSEDLAFNVAVLQHCRNVHYTDKTYYYYRKTSADSLTKRYDNQAFQKWFNLYTLLEKHIEINQLSDEYRLALKNRIIINLFPLLLNIFMSDLAWKNKMSEVKILLNHPQYEQLFKTFSMNNLPMLWNIFYTLCKKKNVYGLYLFITLAMKVK
ncbi:MULTISPECIES: glycosyltransferase family 2 protein [Streptococcus]|uniref:Glycosyltransferase EpsH n=1 Tax=Streptococcus gallinaceus TaxID=165758 RepID=A0ABV2JMA3_9STRE